MDWLLSLYVGFTRARDHLIITARAGKTALITKWMDCLADADFKPLISLPSVKPDGSTCVTTVRGTKPLEVPTRAWTLIPDEPVNNRKPPTPRQFQRPAAVTVPSTTYRIAPSNAKEDWLDLPDIELGETARLHDAIKSPSGSTSDWADCGSAVHAVLGADSPTQSSEERQGKATSMLTAWGTDAGDNQAALANSLVQASDSLRAYVDKRWPTAIWHSEIPIEANVDSPDGERHVSGIIDLLLETPDGYIIVDHKSFPNPVTKELQDRAREYFPQLAAYGRCLEAMNEAPVIGYWIHFGVAGVMVEGVKSEG